VLNTKGEGGVFPLRLVILYKPHRVISQRTVVWNISSFFSDILLKGLLKKAINLKFRCRYLPIQVRRVIQKLMFFSSM
jgi:hypothetical protein